MAEFAWTEASDEVGEDNQNLWCNQDSVSILVSVDRNLGIKALKEYVLAQFLIKIIKEQLDRSLSWFMYFQHLGYAHCFWYIPIKKNSVGYCCSTEIHRQEINAVFEGLKYLSIYSTAGCGFHIKLSNPGYILSQKRLTQKCWKHALQFWNERQVAICLNFTKFSWFFKSYLFNLRRVGVGIYNIVCTATIYWWDTW